MTSSRPVDEYLVRLAAALTLSRRQRRRVLAETEDHLRCRVTDLIDAGQQPIDAERAAVGSFGEIAPVAASHARIHARSAGMRGTAIAWLAVVPFAVLIFVTTQLQSVHEGAPAEAVSGGVAGAAGWIAVQIAVLCAMLAGLRVWRVRSATEPSAGSLRLLNRSAGTAAAAAAVSSILDIAAFTRMPAGQGQHSALVFGLVTLVLAASAISLVQCSRVRRRLRPLGDPDHEGAADDALEDLLAAVLAGLGALRAVPVVGNRISAVERAVSSNASAVDTARRHPWRAGGAAALVIGLITGGSHLVGEGLPPEGLGLALLVLLLIAAIEGAAILACYALFGRFLGIRAG